MEGKLMVDMKQVYNCHKVGFWGLTRICEVVF